MYQPLQFGENAPSISDQLFNMDRAKQAAFMLGPMTTYAGMDALDQMEACLLYTSPSPRDPT